jgi:hypothetical protein
MSKTNPDFEWDPGKNSTKIKYTDEPMGHVEVMKDFLPPPSELAFREETVKSTNRP